MSDNVYDPTRLVFGKYTGRRIREVARENPKYLRWLLKQDWLQEHTRQHIEEELDKLLDELEQEIP